MRRVLYLALLASSALTVSAQHCKAKNGVSTWHKRLG